MKGYLTVAQAAERVGISQKRIREHIYMGNLKAEKVGGIWMIAEEDFATFMQRDRTPGRRPKSQSN